MTAKPLKLHLGAGKRYLPGYTHVDLCDLPHIDYQSRVDNLSMFDDETVDTIYASHVLEYFDRIQVKSVLQEWHRVLHEGGILRLAVPDFEALTQVYSEYGDLNLIHGPLYGRWEIEGSGKLVYHKTVYDFPSLKHVLKEAGYMSIRKWDWQAVFVNEYAGFDDYSQAYIPHMDKENGLLISLNVEVVK